MMFAGGAGRKPLVVGETEAMEAVLETGVIGATGDSAAPFFAEAVASFLGRVEVEARVLESRWPVGFNGMRRAARRRRKR